MPRVKIDYIVSFSSEDPEHPASNLLAWEVSKKKWLCKKGESSCSVVLQLTKAVKISSVHIGAYHSALVEVLVARSEKASDQYQVLVPSCVFVNPSESRRDAPLERVRSFSAEQLTPDARRQRWDRVRVVCSQPYNRHCKYGLSFIHIDESGDDTTVPQPQPTPTPQPQPQPVATPVPQRMLTLDTFSSDEDDFRPGELFAKHLQKNSDSQSSWSDTGAQIRQATSQALKNISESSTKLMKTPINKPNNRRDTVSTSEGGSGRADRSRDTLLYTNDEERPHAKIDQVVQRHKKEKEKEDKAQIKVEKNKVATGRSHRPKEKNRTPKRRKSSSPTVSEMPPSKRPNKNSIDNSSDRKNRRDEKRSKQLAGSEESDQEGEESAQPHTLLQGAVLVLSGYENPQRANVRNCALALGARVQRDWGPACTHLICAFPNTPKLRAVRATPGGGAVPAATAQWLLESAARRRRLPWRWFATEPQQRRARPERLKSPDRPKSPARPKSPSRPKSPESPASPSDEVGDTDDEINKVLQKQKAKQPPATDDQRAKSPQHPQPSPRDVDEGPSTDEDTAEEPAVPRFGGALPNFFDGYTFAIDDEHSDAEQLSRYIKAYGGLTLLLSELGEDSEVDYIVGGVEGAGVGARRVSARWVARCHRAQALLPPD